jgi:drug/metabolite transporter (DMT)-like permease
VVAPAVWLLSLAIVLVAAVLHASWNLIVKRDDDKLISAWLIVLTPSVLLSPLLWWTGLPPRTAWPMLLLSGAIHACYSTWLARAYRQGDLSVVYPIARGLAPLLVALVAPAALGERLSLLAVIAILLVGGGICALGLSAWRATGQMRSLAWAAATAAATAGYSLVDKLGVARANALAYIVVLFALATIFMAPWVLATRGAARVAEVWRLRRGPIVLGGLFSTAAYLLVLLAMQLTQVSYIAALRESSVVIGALLGWRVLKEPLGGMRIAASLVVALGLCLLVAAMRGDG